MTKRKAAEDKRPVGRPSKYSPAYVEEVVAFCAEGYSLTAFAGEIGVGRETITRWCDEHEEFRLAVNRAKAKRARWWEERARSVAESGGTGGQSTMVIFGLKNHAPEDFRDKHDHEHAGPGGGPMEMVYRWQHSGEESA
jgi:hypothetical protein